MEYSESFSLKQNLHERTLSEIIQRNEEQIERYTNFQKQCETILEGLQILPLELSINCMIPIGKQALIKGKLKHTNEILVCLGEGYFVKYSAAQAIELTKRRIKRTQENLILLKSERDLLESRQNYPLSYGAFENNINEELVEHWSDQDLTNWRVQHRQKEKEYHEKKSKEKQVNKNYPLTEEELFQRLDELELEEELTDEYNRLHIDDDDEDDSDDDYDEDDDDDDDDDDDEEDDDDDDDQEKEEIENLESIHSYKQLSKMKKSSTCNHTEKSRDKDKLSNVRKVSFLDICDEDNCDTKPLNIETNSNVENLKVNYNRDSSNTSKINNFDTPSPSHDNDENVIHNPTDIHNVCFQPKSILKPPRDNSNRKDSNFPLQDYSTDKYFESDTTKVSTFENLITQTVQEKKQELTQTHISDSVSKKKPLSRFKLERVNKS
ncbi:RNA polymerase II subunit 5-mediating protein homolog [Leptopilina heterotoma]|uniref:RNA polymerase II subunit 5-mediating protein homolog n=1 Tax=Leptopilina heterotoma TaxID=63436 RepID=UPI001CA8ED35|nr:RNA polymerase II subunit 5-mediating protein homolog [Leptopilina heterotoma]